MSPPSQPALCEVDPRAQPCGELIALRDKVGKQEKRINAALDGNEETAQVLHHVAERVGEVRRDGSVTPRSLTAAIHTMGDQLLAIHRTIEQRFSSDPPQKLYELDDDPMTEITRTDIQRPVHTSRRLRQVSKQRNWMAVGLAIGGLLAGIFEALKLAGVLH